MGRIRVAIFDNSQAQHCPGQCGMAALSQDDVKFVAEHLKERFGEDTELDYLDLAQPSVRKRHRRILKLIEAQNLNLPVVTVNGVPRLSGGVDYRLIAETIEVVREIEDG